MISKRLKKRKDGKSSAVHALSYGEGLKVDLETGKILDKSHRTRLGNFGLVDDGVYSGRSVSEMSELIQLAALEMQSNCDLNTRVGPDKKLAHFVVSYNQDKPSEAVLRGTEDSMLTAMKLDQNHFATFLHNDNGYWHLHLFASRIEKDKPHRGNPLWHDRINRDKVCRVVEASYGLQPDNGMHRVDEAGQIVEIPRAERQARRDARPAGITDQAKTIEIYSGEKSFQSWCIEIRIGDQLKHAKNWQGLHAAASAYDCEIRPKGMGFVILPVGEKGGIQLSKVGLKNMTAKFGQFQPTRGHPCQLARQQTKYTPGPTKPADSLYGAWKEAKAEFDAVKADSLNTLRAAHAKVLADLGAQQHAALVDIRSTTGCYDRASANSVVKLEHAAAVASLATDHSFVRRQLHHSFDAIKPGASFRDYVVKQAAAGDDAALKLSRRYGADEATNVSRQSEAELLNIVATVTGNEDNSVPRPAIRHRIQRNGTIIFDLEFGCIVVDSAITKQVQLNAAAANDPYAIETTLRYASAKFGNTLAITGPSTFQRLVAQIAVRKRLNMTFVDPGLEKYRQDFAERQQPTSQHEVLHSHIDERQGSTPAGFRDPLQTVREVDVVQTSAEESAECYRSLEIAPIAGNIVAAAAASAINEEEDAATVRDPAERTWVNLP